MGSPIELDAAPDDIETVYPCGRWGRGVGFHLRDGRDFYFFTWRGAARALDYLRSVGFPVTYQRGPLRKYWLGRP
jgi:hypothetical protein